MVDFPTRIAFEECLGERFQIVGVAEATLEMELVQVTQPAPTWTRRDGGKSDRPFSLVFRAPSAPALPQAMYPVVNERLGSHMIFLVPIGCDQAGMTYEAVFN
jgi:hypothetical protein